MAAAKRGGAGSPAGARQDIAETERRLKRAQTPIAKKVLGQLLDKKRRVASGQAAKEISTPVPKPTRGKPTAAATSRRNPATRRSS